MFFDQQTHFLFSVLLYVWITEKSIFPIDVNCIRMSALTDSPSNYFLLKFPKPEHFEIS